MGANDKRPRNANGQFHGMWISHCLVNKTEIWAKGMYINGVDLGFWIEEMKEKLYYAR